jgi:2-polyprenyl-3-methyl-5-hydroxy-6-metoxy-1,4-benzoquinol methylase
MNERIVEIPLVLQNISKPSAEILDVGCDESLLTLHLANLGHKVTALDLNKYEFKHSNIKFVKGDICTVDLPEKKYDYIIFLSVIEHVGLGAYGEQGFGGGDRKALEQAKKFLKPDGKIIISTPFGKGAITPAQRVYSEKTIAELFLGFNIELEKYFKGIGQKEWVEAKKEDLANVSSEQFTQGMGFFVISL